MGLKVLEITRDARSIHGLRHQDYQRYRTYCSKKIQRVRKLTGSSQIEDKKYSKKDMDVITDKRQLEILLFQSERAWSYSMQLKLESEKDPRKKFHAIKRLKKATTYSQQLIDFCVDEDASTELEVKAYSTFLNAQLKFETYEWQDALDAFVAARSMYEKLALVSDSTHNQTLCQSVIDEIDPSIRYCAYNLRLEVGQAIDIDELLELRNQSGSLGMDLLSSKIESLLENNLNSREESQKSFEWRNETFVVTNSKLLEAILSIQNLEHHLNDLPQPQDYLNLDTEHEDILSFTKARLELYDKIVGSLWEATTLIETNLKENHEATLKATSSKSDEITNNLKLIQSFIVSKRIAKTLERSQYLIQINNTKMAFQRNGQRIGDDKKAVKHEDNVKLCQAMLQTMKEYTTIQAVEDGSFAALISAQTHYLTALRKYQFNRYYGELNKYEEALLLIEQASETIVHCKLELESVRSMEIDDDATVMADIEASYKALEENLLSSKCACMANLYLQGQNVDHVSSQVESLTLDSKKDISLYSKMSFSTQLDPKATPHIIDLTPSVAPIPIRPMFFDLAYEGIEFPINNLKRLEKGLEPIDRLLEEAEDEDTHMEVQETENSDKKGLLGFLWGK